MKGKQFPEQRVGIQCFVTQRDIDTMLDRFDSGMADITTSNAVAIALRRELGPGADVRVVSSPTHDSFLCVYRGKKIALPRQVSDWLTNCFHGSPMPPLRFEMFFPEEAFEAELSFTE